jgi:hypothetical protein
MKGLQLATISLTGLACAVTAAELKPDDGVSALYDTGAIHEQLMAKKMVRFPSSSTTT